jgi:hypothetical protein
MTTYWTILAITFIVNGEMMTSKLLFPTMKSCGAAMNVLYYDHVQTHFKESMAQCVKSTLVSNKLTKMPRPKPRPVWLENENIVQKPEQIHGYENKHNNIAEPKVEKGENQ